MRSTIFSVTVSYKSNYNVENTLSGEHLHYGYAVFCRVSWGVKVCIRCQSHMLPFSLSVLASNISIIIITVLILPESLGMHPSDKPATGPRRQEKWRSGRKQLVLEMVWLSLHFLGQTYTAIATKTTSIQGPGDHLMIRKPLDLNIVRIVKSCPRTSHQLLRCQVVNRPGVAGAVL